MGGGRSSVDGHANLVRLYDEAQSTPPSGMMFYRGSTIPGWDGTMIFAELGAASNTQAHQVHQIQFDHAGGTSVTFEQALWENQYGRIRDVAEGPDGLLYFSTSNRVWQSAVPAMDDDKILRAKP